MTARFRINTPHVVAETLDGEATIVDLESGIYYALNESGSLIWEDLLSGLRREEIADRLAASYELSDDDASGAVERLVSELSAAGLIVEAADEARNGSAPTETSTPSGNGATRTYSEPKLSTYTDMQELLLLDPIHEVDESGWPSRP